MSKEENIFYVYEHWRPDKDICFYVGKGHGKRANNMINRNPHHKNIQNKLSANGMFVEVKLVADGLDEASAFSIERERIAFWNAYGIKLSNRTAGGEGLSSPILEVRKKISVSAKGNKRSLGIKRSEEERATISRRMAGNKIWLGREFTPEHKANLSKALKGRPGRIKSEGEKAKISAAQKGSKRTPEQILNISAGVKKSWNNRNREVSLETRAKIGAASRGRKMTAEQLIKHAEIVKKGWVTRRKNAFFRKEAD